MKLNLPCLYLSASVVHFGLVCPRWSVLSSKDLCGCAVGPQDQKKERKQLLHVGIPTFHSRKNITPRVHTHPFLSDAACFQHTRHANSPTLHRHIIMRSLFLVRAKSNLSRHACISISRAYLLVVSLARSRARSSRRYHSTLSFATNPISNYSSCLSSRARSCCWLVIFSSLWSDYEGSIPIRSPAIREVSTG